MDQAKVKYAATQKAYKLKLEREKAEAKAKQSAKNQVSGRSFFAHPSRVVCARA